MEAKILPLGSGRAINVLGDNMTLRLSAEDTGGAFTLVEQMNAPGIGIPLHFHKNEDELFLIHGRSSGMFRSKPCSRFSPPGRRSCGKNSARFLLAALPIWVKWSRSAPGSASSSSGRKREFSTVACGGRLVPRRCCRRYAGRGVTATISPVLVVS